MIILICSNTFRPYPKSTPVTLDPKPGQEQRETQENL